MHEFKQYMDQYKRLNMRNAVAYLGYATVVTSLPQLVTAVVLFYGGLLVMADGNDHITSGQLVSFLLYLSSLSDAFNSIGYIFASLTQAVGAADKVFELIHRSPKRKRPTISEDETTHHGVVNERNQTETYHHINQFRKSGVRPTGCSGEVTLNKVMMYYPARPQRRILNDMTLYIPSGSVVALVGPSGGGKSSIVSLIQNLYEPRSGDVFIDGIKISDLCPDWLSTNVAVVSQEPTLFARSIRRNIIYGLEGTINEPSMSDIEEAARLANAHSFIESLPLKYETDVGERGVQLSGGQKQRIAIARALVRKPKVLLLDEATSALDAESEAMVQEAIDKMISNDRSNSSMTVIIVAHRLSTVQNADMIFVVESGKVVESGSHNELMSNLDGAYANLISRQMKERESKKMFINEDSSIVDDSMITLTDETISSPS
jgi:ATP-binding cassette subfamily B (MDR/TAP) protein 9